MPANPLHSAASVAHYTPADWCEEFRYILGGRIALDPASNAFANQVVGAELICSTHGLEVDWNLSLSQVAPGGVLLNPPGKSKDNTGGAAVWWQKLVYEWETGGRSWSAIFVGFSLEILQTAQSYDVLQPGDFPHMVPDRRICFDVETAVLHRKLIAELQDTKPGKKERSLINRMDLVQAALSRGELRFPGDSPTHGNVIVCLAHDVDTMVRFYERLEKRGWTDKKVRMR